MKVKDAAASAAKFKTRAAAAGGDYANGVKAAGADWQTMTAGAGDNYAAGVQAAIGRNAFSKGVTAAGPEKYVRNASGVGAQRYPQGVSAAEGDWQKGTAPYLDTLRNLTPPPRRPKGDPGNYARVQAVGEALRARKLQG
jgi:hypothetical protein